MSQHHHAFSDWPFADSVDTVTFCTDKVAHLKFPVLQVAHDHNGDWHFPQHGRRVSLGSARRCRVQAMAAAAGRRTPEFGLSAGSCNTIWHRSMFL